jgi:hypothetical protein
MISSSRSSAAVCGSFRMPKSSMIRRGDDGEIGEQDFPRAVEGSLGDLFDEQVGFTIDNAIALLDGGSADRLGEMALAGARRPEEERVFALLDEARGGRLSPQSIDSDGRFRTMHTALHAIADLSVGILDSRPAHHFVMSLRAEESRNRSGAPAESLGLSSTIASKSRCVRVMSYSAESLHGTAIIRNNCAFHL